MTYLIISIGILIAALEIYIDKKIWKGSGDDKPFTTIARLILMASIALLFGNDMFPYTFGVMLMTFFLVFDTGLNISRWKDITGIFYYRPYHETYRELLREGHGKELAHKYALKLITAKQRFIYHYMSIVSKLFYHGSGKKKWTYDWLFSRIPPQMEILVKGICFGTAIYLYNQ